MKIAVIPARGGSKRIPRKNIKLFNGIPVIGYAIETAKKSGIFDEIVVSTDDSEISEIALSFGASVPWIRAENLSSDHATTISVIGDAARKLKKDFKNLQQICCIYSTVPLLEPHFIRDGLDLLETNNWNYVISAMRVQHAPERYFSLTEGGSVQLHRPEHELNRSQDFPASYLDAGQFYWGTLASWEVELPIFSSKSTIVELPIQAAVDIDTNEDWQTAENLFRLKRGFNEKPV